MGARLAALLGVARRAAALVVFGYAFVVSALIAFGNAVFLARNPYLWGWVYTAMNYVPPAALSLAALVGRPSTPLGRRLAAAIVVSAAALPAVGIASGGMGLHALSYTVVAALLVRRAAGLPLWLGVGYVYALGSLVADLYEWPVLVVSGFPLECQPRFWFYLAFIVAVVLPAGWLRLDPLGAALLGAAVVAPIVHVYVIWLGLARLLPWYGVVANSALRITAGAALYRLVVPVYKERG